MQVPAASPLRVQHAKETSDDWSLLGLHALTARRRAGAEQHLDPAVGSELRIAERADLDFRRRDPGRDQRLADGADAALAQARAVRIVVSVKSDLQ
jgi:hypothetical protein